MHCTAINIARKCHYCTTSDSDTNTEIVSLFSDTAVLIPKQTKWLKVVHFITKTKIFEVFRFHRTNLKVIHEKLYGCSSKPILHSTDLCVSIFPLYKVNCRILSIDVGIQGGVEFLSNQVLCLWEEWIHENTLYFYNNLKAMCHHYSVTATVAPCFVR